MAESTLVEVQGKVKTASVTQQRRICWTCLR